MSKRNISIFFTKPSISENPKYQAQSLSIIVRKLYAEFGGSESTMNPNLVLSYEANKIEVSISIWSKVMGLPSIYQDNSLHTEVKLVYEVSWAWISG